MSTAPRCPLVFLCLMLVSGASSASAAPVVVETPALTPEQQRERFHLPPGFEIQLVAAEPDIGKPMNLRFDARGRLWVTHSLEYPFPAKSEGVQPRDLNQDMMTDHAPRDRLSYFETIGTDGRGRGLVHFAEGLNIPIGQLPVVWSHAATSALGYSIPAITLYQRGSGNGPAAQSRVLVSGFGNVDTHGMCNSFTRGFDGWIYACHGFRNTSRLDWGTGKQLPLHSGNTIRFRPDGSALEQFTKGQVNPFGMTLDSWGNLYNADCHSMPVTCLLRGATYQSFGKPDDGLGFGPDMIDHNHGSTGICGAAWYEAPQFPADFQKNLFICNPVNGQVHRDKLSWVGSSPKVVTQPEFVTCDDGWFRPVDVQLGPDGALYIADFYNAIIGHYEAPLQHPRRDRTHARIWRVIYTGENHDQPVPDLATLDLTLRSTNGLVAALGHPNFNVRALATNALVDRFAAPLPLPEGVEPEEVSGFDVLSVLEAVLSNEDAPPQQVVHAAWAWSRLLKEPRPTAGTTLQRLATHGDPVVRNHVARILGATSHPDLTSVRKSVLAGLLDDVDARVQRAAVEALAVQPQAAELPQLLNAFERAAAGDDHLRYAIRIALRARLIQGNLPNLASMTIDQQRVLAGVAAAVQPAPPQFADWLCGLVAQHAADDSPIPRAEWRQWLKPAARASESAAFDRLVEAARAGAGEDVETALANARSLLAGRQSGGLAVPTSLSGWAEDLTIELLNRATDVTNRWTYHPLPGERRRTSPFGAQSRPRAGRRGSVVVLSSIIGGEDETGINRSPVFRIPERLSFWLAGHNGFPQTPDRRVSFVRLVDTQTGDVLKQEFPPRADAAREIVWDLKEFAGRQGAIEIVDGNDESAYAWLAAGDFSLPELNPPAFDTGPAAVALIKDFRLSGLQPRLQTMLNSEDVTLRQHAATALVALQPDARIAALLLWADDPEVSAANQALLWTAVRTRELDDVVTALRELLLGAASDRQRKAADLLASDPAGAEALLTLATEGRLSLRLLQQPGLLSKLAALQSSELDRRVADLTRTLPPADQEVIALIAARKAAFQPANCSPDNGKAAFVKRCGVCHQIGNEGAKVGPQLDGVGIRGIDRLLEDILDPNRNVDAAFRSSVIALTDGRILTGLKRRDEGTDVIFANGEGKEFRVPSAEIDEMKLSPASLMPGNFGESIPPEEFADILAWLLTQKPAR